MEMMNERDNVTFNDWLSTIPNYGKFPLYSISMKMLLSIGTYVVIAGAMTEDRIVARIVDYNGDQVVCNLYDVLDPSQSLSCESRNTYGMTEVVQTRKKEVITINKVIDFAFVFTLADVDTGNVNHGGINNCYLIRYRSEDYELEEIGFTYTFPCQSPMHIYFRTSTSRTIWSGIMSLQDVLWKVLNTETQKQLTYSDKVPVNVDTILWDYLLYRCGYVLKVRKVQGVLGKIRSTTTYGFKRSSIRVGKTPYIFRFETKEQLQLLRQIVGDFSTLGCRRKRPKLGNEEKIQYNNKLNVVLGSEEVETPFRNKTYRTCVDIGSDEFGSYVQVVYESYLYTSHGMLNYCDEDISTDSYIIDMMKPLRGPVESVDESMIITISLGSMVRRNEGHELLKVVKVTKKAVTLEYILPKMRSGETIIEYDLNKIHSEINDLCQ